MFSVLWLVAQERMNAGAFRVARRCLRRALQLVAWLYPTRFSSGLGMITAVVGGALMDTGDLAQAVRVFELSLTVYRRIHGTDQHRDVASTLNNMANVLWKQGKLTEALTQYERVLEIDRARLGTDEHPDVASTLNNMAVILQEQGKLTEALTQYERVLEIYRALFGTDEHPDVRPTSFKSKASSPRH